MGSRAGAPAVEAGSTVSKTSWDAPTTIRIHETLVGVDRPERLTGRSFSAAILVSASWSNGPGCSTGPGARFRVVALSVLCCPAGFYLRGSIQVNTTRHYGIAEGKVGFVA